MTKERIVEIINDNITCSCEYECNCAEYAANAILAELEQEKRNEHIKESVINTIGDLTAIKNDD